MSEIIPAVETPVVPAAAEQVVTTPTTTPDDVEAKLAAIAAERDKAIEEGANWKLAALKAKGKQSDQLEDETEDEKIGRIVNETLNATKIAQLDTAKEELLQKVLKENKELKLAHANKPGTPPAGMGSHSEPMVSVVSTVVTSDQIQAFKARGWSDKDIERYKRNLSKNSR